MFAFLTGIILSLADTSQRKGTKIIPEDSRRCQDDKSTSGGATYKFPETVNEPPEANCRVARQRWIVVDILCKAGAACSAERSHEKD